MFEVDWVMMMKSEMFEEDVQVCGICVFIMSAQPSVVHIIKSH